MSIETETLEMIKSSLDSLSKGIQTPSKEQKVLRRIRKIRKSQNPEMCINAATWLMTHHMNGFNQSENSKQMTAVLKRAENDLEHALSLLQMDFKDESQKLQALVLSADIAQKLSRFDKLSGYYLKLKTHAHTNPQLVFLTLSIAPTMGDWKTFYNLGKYLEKEYKNQTKNIPDLKKNENINIVEALHQLAEAGMPDLGVLYSLVKSLKLFEIPRANPKKLYEKTVELECEEISLVKLTTDDPEKEKSIKELFEKQLKEELNLKDLAIAVNGGIILFPGLSKEVPQILVGPYFDAERIDVEGYVDVSLSENDEHGNPKMGFNTPEFVNEIMGFMPQDILMAAQTGELSLEQLFESVGSGLAQPGAQMSGLANGGAMIRPELKQSFENFSKMFEEKRPDIMSRYGQSLMRQHERMALRKTSAGYEGTYTVRNYCHMEKSDDTTVEFSLKLKCTEHLPPPPEAPKENGVAEVESGIEGLALE